jgi:DNA-binding FrmR family transcriptional regulator
MEPRLGRMFHSSATGRRRDAILPNQSRSCQVLHQTPISSVGGPWFGSRRHGRSLLLLPRLSSAAAHPSFVIDVDKLAISPQDSIETVISNEWSDRGRILTRANELRVSCSTACREQLERVRSHRGGHHQPGRIVIGYPLHYRKTVPSMAHTIKKKAKLLNRVKRVRGQIEALQRAVEEEGGCTEVLHLVVTARGSMNSLMAEIIEDHIREHVVDPDRERGSRARGAEELIDIVQAYLK